MLYTCSIVKFNIVDCHQQPVVNEKYHTHKMKFRKLHNCPKKFQFLQIHCLELQTPMFKSPNQICIILYFSNYLTCSVYMFFELKFFFISVI